MSLEVYLDSETPRETKNERIVRAFMDGLSRRQVARKYKVGVARVDDAIRKALR